VKSGRCRPFEFPGPSESPKILILVGLPCTAPVSRALHLLRKRSAGLHWDALFLWQGCTFFANALCLQTSDISKKEFTGLELASFAEMVLQSVGLAEFDGRAAMR
jgi:hypothetical protein